MNAYKHTILLPRTDYAQHAQLPALEARVRERWRRLDLYAAVRQAREGQPKWILHDGPPYANGDLHVGTGQNKVLKDIVVRVKTMQGFDAPFVPGWDCHGLPIEHKIVKDLGDAARELAPAAIRDLCRESALRFVERQRRQFQDLGVMADWDRPYLTLSREYELGVVEMFEALVERGHVYRGRKPITWCITDRTALAEAEVEYRRLPSPSVYLAFPLVGAWRDRADVDLIVWTTTPWTLPGNVAAAVHPALEYVACEYSRAGNRRTALLARHRYHALASRLGLGDIVASCRGAELEGLTYAHPLWDQPCPVVLADHVTATDGAGIVHTAPGHGEEDFQAGQAYGLPTLSPVDDGGVYTSEAREWAGVSVRDADAPIVGRMRARGLLLEATEIEHDYPCCWRCKNPVIYRATPQWFISVDANEGRARALAAVDATKWVPAWGATRIGAMLRRRPDWCISRQRAWGVPIPALLCTVCETPRFEFASVKALFATGGADAWFTAGPADLLAAGARCSCGAASFRLERDIFDVWFESGASQHSVLDRHPALARPADLYLEGTDQHRGWFQSSLLESVLAGREAPFRTVVTNGFLVDARTGDKFSKSGYLIPTEEVSATYGSDLFRLWIASLDFTDDIPFSREILEARAPYYVKIRNTFRFLLGNLWDFDPAEDALAYERLLDIDRWALHELAVLTREVTTEIEGYTFHAALQRLHHFCVVTMSAVYFDIVKDRLYTWGQTDAARRSAQTALHEILHTLVRLYAPVLVHSCEEVWEHFRAPSKTPSVHLSAWPSPPDEWLCQPLGVKYASVWAVRAAVNRALEALRKAGAIGRSLDASVTVYAADPTVADALADADLASLFIVSEAAIATSRVGLEDPDLRGLWVQAERSPHPRCDRCWARRATVGADAVYPDVCDRCARTVQL